MVMHRSKVVMVESMNLPPTTGRGPIPLQVQQLGQVMNFASWRSASVK